MIVPGGVQGTASDQVLQGGKSQEFPVTFPQDLQVHRINIGSIAKQDDCLGIERLDATPDCCRTLVFIGAQVIGATLGGLLIQKLLPVELANRCLYGTPHLHPDLSIGQGIGIEILATFILGFSICATVLNNKVPIQTGGFGIGAAVAFLVYAFGPLTGAAMNPARQLGSALAAGHWDHHWLYWVGPVTGAILALQICTRLFGKETEKQETKTGE